jgi:hypothetical protein
MPPTWVNQPSPPVRLCHKLCLTRLRLRHGRLAVAECRLLAVADATGLTGLPASPGLRRRFRFTRDGVGREAEAGGRQGRRRPLLRALQRYLRPPSSAHRRGAEDARFRGAALPARHARGE